MYVGHLEVLGGPVGAVAQEPPKPSASEPRTYDLAHIALNPPQDLDFCLDVPYPARLEAGYKAVADYCPALFRVIANFVGKYQLHDGSTELDTLGPRYKQILEHARQLNVKSGFTNDMTLIIDTVSDIDSAARTFRRLGSLDNIVG